MDVRLRNKVKSESFLKEIKTLYENAQTICFDNIKKELNAIKISCASPYKLTEIDVFPGSYFLKN